MADPGKRKKLYDYLKSQKMTNLDFDTFSKEYGTNQDKFSKLYSYLSQENLTPLSSEDFKNSYFGDIKKKVPTQQDSILESGESPSPQPNDDISTSETSSGNPIYDQYLEAVEVTPEQMEKLRAQANSAVPVPYSSTVVRPSKEESEAKFQKLLKQAKKDNKVNYLRNLPEEELDKLEAFSSKEITNLGKVNKEYIFNLEALDKESKNLKKEWSSLEYSIEQAASNGQTITPEQAQNIEQRFKQISARLKDIAEEASEDIEGVEKNNTDIQDFYKEFDLFKRNYSRWNNFVQQTNAGVRNIVSGAVLWALESEKAKKKRLNSWGIEHEIPDFYEDYTSGEYDRRTKELLGGIIPTKTIEEVNSFSDFRDYAATAVAEQLGILGTISTPYGIGTLGTSVAGGKLKEIDDINKERRALGQEEISRQKRALAATLSAGAEMVGGLVDKITLKGASRVFKKGNTTSLTKKAATEWAKSLGREIPEEVVLGTWGQNAIDIHLLDKENVHIFDHTWDVIAKTGITVGAINSTSIGYALAGDGMSSFMRSRDKAIINENNKKALKLQKQLKDGNLTEKEQTLVKKELDKLIDQNIEAFERAEKTLESLDPKISETVGIVDTELKNNKKNLKRVEESENLDGQTKEDLSEELNRNIEILEKEREEILDIFDKDSEKTPTQFVIDQIENRVQDIKSTLEELEKTKDKMSTEQYEELYGRLGDKFVTLKEYKKELLGKIKQETTQGDTQTDPQLETTEGKIEETESGQKELQDQGSVIDDSEQAVELTEEELVQTESQLENTIYKLPKPEISYKGSSIIDENQIIANNMSEDEENVAEKSKDFKDNQDAFVKKVEDFNDLVKCIWGEGKDCFKGLDIETTEQGVSEYLKQQEQEIKDLAKAIGNDTFESKGMDAITNFDFDKREEELKNLRDARKAEKIAERDLKKKEAEQNQKKEEPSGIEYQEKVLPKKQKSPSEQKTAKPKELKDLDAVVKHIFGLEGEQGDASATLMKNVITNMAERLGETVEETLGRFDFEKTSVEDIKKRFGLFFQEDEARHNSLFSGLNPKPLAKESYEQFILENLKENDFFYGDEIDKVMLEAVADPRTHKAVSFTAIVDFNRMLDDIKNASHDELRGIYGDLYQDMLDSDKGPQDDTLKDLADYVEEDLDLLKKYMQGKKSPDKLESGSYTIGALDDDGNLIAKLSFRVQVESVSNVNPKTGELTFDKKFDVYLKQAEVSYDLVKPDKESLRSRIESKIGRELDIENLNDLSDDEFYDLIEQQLRIFDLGDVYENLTFLEENASGVMFPLVKTLYDLYGEDSVTLSDSVGYDFYDDYVADAILREAEDAYFNKPIKKDALDPKEGKRKVEVVGKYAPKKDHISLNKKYNQWLEEKKDEIARRYKNWEKIVKDGSFSLGERSLLGNNSHANEAVARFTNQASFIAVQSKGIGTKVFTTYKKGSPMFEISVSHLGTVEAVEVYKGASIADIAEGYTSTLYAAEKVLNKPIMGGNIQVYSAEPLFSEIDIKNIGEYLYDWMIRAGELNTLRTQAVNEYVEQSYRLFVEKAIETLKDKFGVNYKIINDPNVHYRGRVYKGVPEVNLYYATPDTPFHEYAHVFINLVKNQNIRLYRQLFDSIKKDKQGKAILERIKKENPNWVEWFQEEEAIAQLLGELAADRIKNKTLKQKLQDFWTKILKSFGVFKNVNIVDIKASTKLKDLALLLADPRIHFDQRPPKTLKSVTGYNSEYEQHNFEVKGDKYYAKLYYKEEDQVVDIIFNLEKDAYIKDYRDGRGREVLENIIKIVQASYPGKIIKGITFSPAASVAGDVKSGQKGTTEFRDKLYHTYFTRVMGEDFAVYSENIPDSIDPEDGGLILGKEERIYIIPEKFWRTFLDDLVRYQKNNLRDLTPNQLYKVNQGILNGDFILNTVYSDVHETYRASIGEAGSILSTYVRSKLANIPMDNISEVHKLVNDIISEFVKDFPEFIYTEEDLKNIGVDYTEEGSLGQIDPDVIERYRQLPKSENIGDIEDIKGTAKEILKGEKSMSFYSPEIEAKLKTIGEPGVASLLYFKKLYNDLGVEGYNKKVAKFGHIWNRYKLYDFAFKNDYFLSEEQLGEILSDKYLEADQESKWSAISKDGKHVITSIKFDFKDHPFWLLNKYVTDNYLFPDFQTEVLGFTRDERGKESDKKASVNMIIKQPLTKVDNKISYPDINKQLGAIELSEKEGEYEWDNVNLLTNSGDIIEYHVDDILRGHVGWIGDKLVPINSKIYPDKVFTKNGAKKDFIEYFYHEGLEIINNSPEDKYFYEIIDPNQITEADNVLELLENMMLWNGLYPDAKRKFIGFQKMGKSQYALVIRKTKESTKKSYENLGEQPYILVDGQKLFFEKVGEGLNETLIPIFDKTKEYYDTYRLDGVKENPYKEVEPKPTKGIEFEQVDIKEIKNVKQTAKDIAEGLSELQVFDGEIEAKRKNLGEAAIAAVLHLRGIYQNNDSKEIRKKKKSETYWEVDEVMKMAKDNGYLLSESDLEEIIDFTKDSFIESGGEAEVFHAHQNSNPGKVVKLFNLEGKIDPGLILNKLERFLISNHLFPEVAVEVAGFIERKGKRYMVMYQPFVDSVFETSSELDRNLLDAAIKEEIFEEWEGHAIVLDLPLADGNTVKMDLYDVYNGNSGYIKIGDENLLTIFDAQIAPLGVYKPDGTVVGEASNFYTGPIKGMQFGSDFPFNATGKVIRVKSNPNFLLQEDIVNSSDYTSGVLQILRNTPVKKATPKEWLELIEGIGGPSIVVETEMMQLDKFLREESNKIYSKSAPQYEDILFKYTEEISEGKKVYNQKIPKDVVINYVLSNILNVTDIIEDKKDNKRVMTISVGDKNLSRVDTSRKIRGGDKGGELFVNYAAIQINNIQKLDDSEFDKNGAWLDLTVRRLVQLAANESVASLEFAPEIDNIVASKLKSHFNRMGHDVEIKKLKDGRVKVNFNLDSLDSMLDPVPYSQKDNKVQRAAIQKFDNMKYVIYALENPNVVSPIHELLHAYEDVLTAEEKQTILDWAGHSKWGVNTSEAFARGAELYLSEGKAPDSKLKDIFEKFSKWLREIYNDLIKLTGGIELNDQMRDIYSKIFNITPDQAGKYAIEESATEINLEENIGAWLEEFNMNMEMLDQSLDEIAEEVYRAQPKDAFSAKSVDNTAKLFGINQKDLKQSAKAFSDRIYNQGDIKPATMGEGKDPKKITEIIKLMSELFDTTISFNKVPQGAGGVYSPGSTGIDLRGKNDLVTAAHEIGHSIADAFDLEKKIRQNLDQKDLLVEITYLSEQPLASKPPKNASEEQKKKYVVGEGIAEFIRAYLMNKEETVNRVPNVYDLLINRVLPEDVVAALDVIEQEYNKFFTGSASDKIGANVETFENKDTIEKLADFIRSKVDLVTGNNNVDMGKKKLYKNPVQKALWWLHSNYVNPLKFANEAYYFALENTKGIKKKGKESKLKPSEDFEILSRLLAGFNTKIYSMWKDGLSLYGNKMLDSNGEIFNVDYLFKPIIAFFGEVEPNIEQTNDFMNEAIKYMVAQRTVEYAKKFAQRDFKDNNVDVDKYVSDLYDRYNSDKEVLRELVVEIKKQDKLYHKMQGKKVSEIETDYSKLDTVDKASDFFKLLQQNMYDIHFEYYKKSNALTGIGGGESDFDVAQKYLEDFEGKDAKEGDAIKDAARRYREFADASLKYAVKKGRLKLEDYKTITESNEFYVNLTRNMEFMPFEEAVQNIKSGSNLASVKDIIKRVKGGTDRIKNPYMNLLLSVGTATREADRNEILQQWIEPFRNFREMGGDNFADLAELATLAEKGDKQTIRIFYDGFEEYWQIKDKNIYKAIKGIGDNSVPKALKILTSPNRALRWTITNFPIFGLRNFGRDTMHTTIVSKHGKQISDSFKFKKNFKHLSDFELYGGSQAGFHQISEDAYLELLQMKMKEISKKGGIILDIRKPWLTYKRVLEQAENANRLAEFAKAKEHALKKLGYDEYNANIYAAFHARDLMDFALVGHHMKVIREWLVFSNAFMQGIRRTGKAFKENPGRTSLMLAVVNVIPTLLVHSLLSQIGAEDEYEELPLWQRDLFWNFKIPGHNGWVSVPKPHELGIPSIVLDRMISYNKGYDNAFKGMEGTMLNTYLPISMDSENPQSIVGDLLGPGKGFAEVLSNQDYFRGTTIIPPNELNKAIWRRDGADKASRLSKNISKAFGLYEDPGVDPRYIDHLISGYGTYFGKLILKTSDIGIEDSRHRFNLLYSTGFGRETSAASFRSVTEMYNNAVASGKLSHNGIKIVQQLIKESYTIDDPKKKEQKHKEIYETAAQFAEYYKLTLEIQEEKDRFLRSIESQ